MKAACVLLLVVLCATAAFAAPPNAKGEKKAAARASAIEISGVSAGVWLSESAKSQSSDESVLRATYPGTLASPLVAMPSQHLYAELTLNSATKDFQPAQVFLQLCRAGVTPSKCAVYPAKPKADKVDGKFIVKINLGSSDVVEALYGAGAYDLQVIIGDSQLVKPLKWRLGAIDIKYAGADAIDRHIDPFAPLPAIEHKFRTAEARPPAVIAYAFSLVSLLPFVGLLAAIAEFGPRISFPTDPQESLMSLLFQGSIVAILATYVWYWLALNIFQALSIVGVLALVAVFTGNQSLRLLNQRKLAKLEKQA